MRLPWSSNTQGVSHPSMSGSRNPFIRSLTMPTAKPPQSDRSFIYIILYQCLPSFSKFQPILYIEEL
uniref:Uncharacterized protein n=1 Tax=Cannabis sativa TaxID=3483 RepID=A0A803R2U9_CANSA